MTRVHPSAKRSSPALRLLGGVLVLLALLLALLISQAVRIRAGAEAYLYGYPLVIMELSRQGSAAAVGPENTLRRVRRFPAADFKAVVRPNVDTLYTSAFINADQGPWVFEMAANAQRYALMPFMDAWTHVFASPGTRTTGTGPASYLLVGPGWQGTPPPGLTLLRAPTQMVWLIGRTQTNGVADYATAHRLQDGLSLRSLADWQAGRPTPEPAWRAAATPPVAPIAQMLAMDVSTFFGHLARLMQANPPHAQDRAMLDQLARLGVGPGQPPRWGWLERQSVALGRSLADWRIGQALRDTAGAQQGWRTPPANLGDYGSDYATRAAVAMVGLGANLPADSLYPSTRLDAQGQPLHGDHRYRLHFAAGQLPPVRAFWSVTAYGMDDFFLPVATGRYAIGDRDPLQYNADGSLDLWLQAEAPEEARRSNWLPVLRGQPFQLTARLYWPEPAALGGTWTMPGLERQR